MNMIRINKNVAVFFGIVVGISLISLIVIKIFYPILFPQTTSSCTIPSQFFSIQIPHLFPLVPLGLLVLFLSLIMLKISLLFFHTIYFKEKLLVNLGNRKPLQLLLEKLQLSDKTLLIRHKKVFAFCFGVSDPKIYISTALVKLMDDKELEAVLRHEKYHLQNRDNLIMMALSATESFFLFLPILSDIARNFRVGKEIQADHEAIQGLRDAKPLISVMRKMLEAPRLAVGFVPAIADVDSIEPRIKAIIKQDFRYKTFKRVNIILSTFIVVVISILTITPVYAVDFHSSQQDIMVLCMQGNKCMKACQPLISGPAYPAKQMGIQNASHPDIIFSSSR